LQAGWPGITATLLHGISPTVDLGGAFSFNYGAEGLTNSGLIPGLKFQGVGRIKLLDTGKVNLGVKFAPGLFLYFKGDTSVGGFNFPNTGYTAVGMILPFGLSAGFPVAPQLMVVAGFDLNFAIVFTQGGFVTIPILFGGGMEYEIQRDMLLTFHLRMGPGIVAGGGFSGTGFAMEALLGLAFKL
jgi:hypothetical protein